MIKTITNYTFNAVGKTVTFTDYSGTGIALERVLLVRNETTGMWVYSSVDFAYNGTVATNVLTFTADSTGMNNTDKLLIRYDDPADQNVTVTGVSNAANQTTGNTSLGSIDTKLSSQATAANQATANASLSSVDTKLSSQATAANQGTANSSLSSIDTKLSSQATAANQTAANASLSTIAGKDFATQTTIATLLTQSDYDTKAGSLTETAPASDTASSGLNGRLQRIAQRITSLIGLFPTSLGQKTMANGLPVTIASDQSSIPVTGPLTDTQLRATAVPVSGPLTDTQIRATALPISAASLPLPSGASTSAKQPTLGTAGTPSADVITVQGVTSMTPLKTDGSAVTQPVSGPLTDTQLRATPVPISGTVTANLGTIDGASSETTLAALNTKTPTAVAKATQGATGFPTQDLKDSGRSSRTIILDSFAIAATTETLNTMSYSTDNGTATTGTSYAVTTAKRFRMQTIVANIHTIAGNTTAVNVVVRIRVNNGGAAIVSSPVQFIIAIQGVAAANQAGIPVSVSIPDGYELVAGAGVGVTTTCAGFVATTAAPKVDITIIGYEY